MPGVKRRKLNEEASVRPKNRHDAKVATTTNDNGSRARTSAPSSEVQRNRKEIEERDNDSDAESWSGFEEDDTPAKITQDRGEDEALDITVDADDGANGLLSHSNGDHGNKSSETSATTSAPELDRAKKTFADLGVIDVLCEACKSLGYTHPTPIQEAAIPVAMKSDLIGLAETGSGKTAAFTIPLLQNLMEKPQPFHSLIMAPTRELAHQINQNVQALGASMGVKSVLIVGGLDMIPQAIALGKRPHVIVATPGRLYDHLTNTKGFSLRTLKYLVLDEADRLLDMDFGPVLDKILKILPREGRRSMLFSATISSKVESLQRAALQNPVKVNISSSDHQLVSTLIQSYIFCPQAKKDVYLVYLLNEFAGHSAIVFCRTVAETQRLSFLLRALGFGAIPIHGQLSQSARLGALSKFRSGSRDILLATDVAARGLDIPSVDYVIQHDLPGDSKSFVHRVGRTARAGRSGKAICLVTQYDVEVLLRIEHAIGQKLKEHEGVDKDAVMMFAERVQEAQRVAIKQVKLEAEGGNGRGRGGKRKGKWDRGKGGADDRDVDEG